jgi:hypothetical protein
MENNHLIKKLSLSMGKIMLLAFVVSSMTIVAQNNEKLTGKVKGQTIDGKWWWTLSQEDGTYCQFGWWGLQKAELMEVIKTLWGKMIVVDCITKMEDNQKVIETINSYKLYDPNEVVKADVEKKEVKKEKAKKKTEDGYKGVIKGQTINGEWWWTLVGDDGVTYKFGWWALDKAGYKERIKSMQGKRYIVNGDFEVENGSNVFNEINDITLEAAK